MSSRKRLTWRALRDTSDVPFLAASSSSSTTIGMNKSCSSKRNRLVGSCISTFVSRTKIFFFMRAGTRTGASPALLGGGKAGRGSEGFRRLEDFLGVALDLHRAPFARELAGGVEQERAAVHAHVFLAVHALFADHVERLAGGAFGVGKEREGEAELGDEIIVAAHAVLGDAQDLDAGFLELGIQVAEVLAFLRAAGSVVLGIEVDNELLALEGGQLHLLVAGGRQGEVRQLVA